VKLRARIAPLLLAGAFASARVDAQQSVVVRDAGPGPVGRELAQALAAPHVLIGPGPIPVLLPRDSAYAQTVIILQRDAIIEARVHGDIIVVGGDAFLHPGAIVDGRVVAIGGGVYESRLAITRGGTVTHRDFTFAVHNANGLTTLDYQRTRVQAPALFSLPGLYGLRIPAYDRIDGLSLPFGPTVTLDTGDVTIDPTVTYRSNIGAFDPALNATLALGRRTSIDGFVGRTTATNDYWIWSDLVNSVTTFGAGLDTRNYYRADRAELTLHHLFETTTTELEAFFGARDERDWSVPRDSNPRHAPWSVFEERSKSRMLRPNPAVSDGWIRSLLLGGHLGWEEQRVRATVDLTNEAAAFDVTASRFVQSTVEAQIRFPTFGTQEFFLSTHVLETFGDTAPPQRWSYLGGSGTIPTLPLLSLGGDHLLYVESNYYIPFPKLDLPVLGAPSVTLRHMIGSAGVGRLPAFHQNLGLRFALSFARLDVNVDPATRSWELGVGLSLAR
jgi:hypothetical protein